MKRKQGVSELRTNPISLQLSRCPLKINSFFGVQKLQPYFPPIEVLFKTESLDRVFEYGIRFPEPLVSVTDGIVKTLSGNEYAVHPKITMLLSPYKWMKGEHTSLELPTVSQKASLTHSKLQSPNTAGYVGAILSAVLSHSGCDHFPKVFGTYTGISGEHTIDISDDYEDLSEISWFSKNVGKTFDLKLNDIPESHIEYTRSARPSIRLGEEIVLDSVEEIEGIPSNVVEACEMTELFTDENKETFSDSSSDVSTSYIFAIESLSVSDLPEDFDSLEEDDEDEPFAWATFKDVPVQITLMEKLEGSLYDLLIKFSEPEKHHAWLFQIVAALAFAQRTFGFTHNDLHGNNVMYIQTSKEYLYYSHNGVQYCVPTYGYLLKIIDFDRGIGYIRLPGMKEPKMFISDQFDLKEEAGGQYNIPPFFSSKFHTIKPNPSFDLVRLATSLFWDLFPNGPKFDKYLENPVFKLFMKWLTFPDGSSVLFFKENPKLDRYSGFDLYKAIARYSKDTAIPRKELGEFKVFIGEIPLGEHHLLIDI